MACLMIRTVSCASKRSSYTSLRSGDYDDDFPTEDSFLDMLSKFQGRRMDDQRTTLPKSLSPENKGAESIADDDDFIDVLWRLQSSRIEDQRCSMATAPHLMPAGEGEEEEVPDCQTTDELFDLIFRCQSSRINDQRCPEPNVCRKSTMPSEDFFNLIQHLQSTRIEDQRTPFPLVAAN